MPGGHITNQDLGFYIANQDVGLHATQVTSGFVTGSIGIRQWGLAQFGTTGILGFTPTIFANVRRLNLLKVV